MNNSYEYSCILVSNIMINSDGDGRRSGWRYGWCSCMLRAEVKPLMGSYPEPFSVFLHEPYHRPYKVRNPTFDGSLL